MKRSELRQLIKEEYDKITSPRLLKEENGGLITFDQVKQAVSTLYKDYSGGEIDSENDIQSTNDIDELVNVLDSLGFNETEAYDFIFDAILK